MQTIASTIIWTTLFAIAAGCGGAPTRGGAGPNEPFKLDVPGEWIDPEEHLIQGAAPAAQADPLANPDAPVIAITGGTVLTAAGQRFAPGVVILAGGSIREVGAAGAVTVPEGAHVIDATNRYVTPGIIDAHSHLGVYSSPGVTAARDGNEMSAPVTANVRAEYAYWPQDPGIPRALAGGVTTALVLPGSANLIGGHGFTVVMRPARTAGEVRFPGAPDTLKMACGENPKRVYGDKGGPQTRMGEYAAFRAVFRQAAMHNLKLELYEQQRAQWLKKRERASALEAEARALGKTIDAMPAPEPPASDPVLDTLAAVLRGEVLVQVHCYRSDDIRQMVAVADDGGFAIRSFHHALEAYKVRDLLVERDIGINTWADWWGFKMEAFDGIPQNAALFTESGGRAVIHSDSGIDIQRLNQEAAKAMWAGRHAGIEISDDQALRWVTANPAWVLGIQDVTGTLEAGKRADVVVWSESPFSVYSKADLVVQGGEVAYDREQGRALTDFELGNAAATGAQ